MSRPAFRVLAPIACLAALLLSACGPSPTLLDGGPGDALVDPTHCPNDLPGACPSPAPSWSREVSRVVGRSCTPCHSPTGAVANRPLGTWAEVFAQRQPVLTQVYSCRMPNDGGVPLTVDERQAVLGWLVCGAPQN